MFKRIVFATHNINKAKEVSRALVNYDIEVVTASELDIPDVEETGLTFVENAIIKARNACKHSGLPSFADDSGLIVPSLNGEPGIYSARYAGVGTTKDENISKLLKEMNKIPNCSRDAKFCCVIVFMLHEKDPNPRIFESFWDGEILDEPSGVKGFGYDPVFYVPTHKCSAAELELDEKNRISHRGLSIEKLSRWLTKTTDNKGL